MGLPEMTVPVSHRFRQMASKTSLVFEKVGDSSFHPVLLLDAIVAACFGADVQAVRIRSRSRAKVEFNGFAQQERDLHLRPADLAPGLDLLGGCHPLDAGNLLAGAV